jgi:hypothetical protein
MNATRSTLKSIASGAAAAGLILALSACGTIDIASAWRASEIVVDGRAGDWGGHLRVIEKTPFAVGVLNDGDHLYVCLRADAAAGAAGIDRTGMTVWIDPKGGNQKFLGVHYPIGMDFGGFPPENKPVSDPSMGERRDRPREGNPPEMPEDVEILGPGRDESTRLKRGELKGIEVALAGSPGGYVYELKIPLKKSENPPFAVEVSPAGIVGIGFEPGEAMGGMMGNRGMGGMGGMGGRSGMPGGPAGMGGVPSGMGGGESFKAWLKVTLAKPTVTPKS